MQKCPLCNSLKINKFLLNKDSTQFFKCTNCDLVFNMLTEKDLEIDYSSYNVENKNNHFSNLVDKQRAKEISGYLKKNGKILDVGCGNGKVLMQLSKIGHYKLNGIEPSEICSKNARKNCPEASIINKYYEKVKIKEKMDVIVSYHVLEHLEKPEKLLQFCYDNLKKGGMLIIEYPDINSIHRKILKSEWYFLYSAHIRFIPTKLMKKLLKKHNFKLVKKTSSGGLAQILKYFQINKSGKNKISSSKKLSGIKENKTINIFYPFARRAASLLRLGDGIRFTAIKK